jgi:integrase
MAARRTVRQPIGSPDSCQSACVYVTLPREQIRNEPLPQGGGFEKMARRRYQKPTPEKRGNQWTNALVFQSIKTGAPMRDNTVLSRHIKPAARKLGIGWVNWQVLRRSCATWLDQAQVNVKDAQGLMRHSRASTTQDVYQQVVPEAQRKAVRKLTAFVRASVKEAVTVQ